MKLLGPCLQHFPANCFVCQDKFFFNNVYLFRYLELPNQALFQNRPLLSHTPFTLGCCQMHHVIPENVSPPLRHTCGVTAQHSNLPSCTSKFVKYDNAIYTDFSLLHWTTFYTTWTFINREITMHTNMPSVPWSHILFNEVAKIHHIFINQQMHHNELMANERALLISRIFRKLLLTVQVGIQPQNFLTRSYLNDKNGCEQHKRSASF